MDTARTLEAGEVLDRSRHYTCGTWIESDGEGRIEVRNPATRHVIAVVAEGTACDVDKAVVAARAALPA